ncbi:MAG: YfjI family protein [Candidatus Thiodiazotropha endolucinida]
MDHEWPPIVPLMAVDLPPFPVEALPPVLRRFSEEVAESYQVPVDMPAMLSLVTAAVPLSKYLRIQLRPDWSEPCNVYVAVALPPASRKSAVVATMTKPLYAFERESKKAIQSTAKRAKLKQDALSGKLKKAKKAAEQANPDELDQALREIEEIENQMPETPTPVRLVADDVTPEKLASLLAENDGKMAIISAEGGIFESIAGRYSNGIPNLDVILKGHAGDNLRVDRVGRDTELVDSPALTIGLTVQPEVLKGLAVKPGFRDRGLIGRFWLVMPPSMIGSRKIETQPIFPDTRIKYEYLIGDLLDLFHHIGDDQLPTTRYISLEPEAGQIFKEYCQSIEKELGPGGSMEMIKDWGGKLAGGVARIAAILHAAIYPKAPWDSKVNSESMSNAIKIGIYLQRHALSVFQLMGADPDMNGVQHILEWVQRERIKEFSVRDVHIAHRSRFQKSKEILPCLNILIERGYIKLNRSSDHKGPGRKPSPKYMVNPGIQSHFA